MPRGELAAFGRHPAIMAACLTVSGIFSFGAFMEGAAGFGTPEAFSAAVLVGLGFRPLQAAILALAGNTALAVLVGMVVLAMATLWPSIIP